MQTIVHRITDVQVRQHNAQEHIKSFDTVEIVDDTGSSVVLFLETGRGPQLADAILAATKV